MDKHTVIFLGAMMVILVGSLIIYFTMIAPVQTVEAPSAVDVSVEPPADTATSSFCDEFGNRYSTAAEAEAAGLSAEQYGATYCPEYVAASTGDYTGLTVAQAQEIATARGEMFRVVEIDGESQMVTQDLRPGRINAVVTSGLVSSYSVEAELSEAVAPKERYDELYGLTTDEAMQFAAANNLTVRIGMVGGEALPVTMDFLPGRITITVDNDVVTGFSIEE